MYLSLLLECKHKWYSKKLDQQILDVYKCVPSKQATIIQKYTSRDKHWR